MQKIKKKIRSLISSLLVAGSFLSTSSKFKAFGEDFVYSDEYDGEYDSEDDDEEFPEADDYGLEVGIDEKIKNYVKKNPVKTSMGGLLGLYLLYKTHNVLKTPSEKLDFLLDEIIKNADKRYSLDTDWKNVSLYEKSNLLHKIYVKLSERMLSLNTSGPIVESTNMRYNSIKNAFAYLSMRLYMSLRSKNTDKLTRRTLKNREFLTCLEVSVIMSELAKRIGWCGIIKVNRSGHVSFVSPLVKFDESSKSGVQRIVEYNPVFKQKGYAPAPNPLWGFNPGDVLIVRNKDSGYRLYRVNDRTWLRNEVTKKPVEEEKTWAEAAIKDFYAIENNKLNNSRIENKITYYENPIIETHIFKWLDMLIKSFDSVNNSQNI